MERPAQATSHPMSPVLLRRCHTVLYLKSEKSLFPQHTWLHQEYTRQIGITLKEAAKKILISQKCLVPLSPNSGIWRLGASSSCHILVIIWPGLEMLQPSCSFGTTHTPLIVIVTASNSENWEVMGDPGHRGLPSFVSPSLKAKWWLGTRPTMVYTLTSRPRQCDQLGAWQV